jgi:hypothetical protein
MRGTRGEHEGDTRETRTPKPWIRPTIDEFSADEFSAELISFESANMS